MPSARVSVLLAALAGCLGALAADRWANNDAEGSLHQFVHDELSGWQLVGFGAWNGGTD